MDMTHFTENELDYIWRLWLLVPNSEQRRIKSGWPARRYHQAMHRLIASNRIPRLPKIQTRRRVWHLLQLNWNVEKIALVTGLSTFTIERFWQEFARDGKMATMDDYGPVPAMSSGKPKDYNPPDLSEFWAEACGWGTRYSLRK